MRRAPFARSQSTASARRSSRVGEGRQVVADLARCRAAPASGSRASNSPLGEPRAQLAVEVVVGRPAPAVRDDHARRARGRRACTGRGSDGRSSARARPRRRRRAWRGFPRPGVPRARSPGRRPPRRGRTERERRRNARRRSRIRKQTTKRPAAAGSSSRPRGRLDHTPGAAAACAGACRWRRRPRWPPPARSARSRLADAARASRCSSTR